MQVIILKTQKNLGKQNEIKEVKDGYALNYLIPNGLACKATPDRVAQAKQAASQQQKQVKVTAANKDKWKTTLKTVALHFKAKVNEQGHLYSQINSKMIREELGKQFGVNLPESSFKNVQPIKTLGNSIAQLKIDNEIISLKIKVDHE